MGRNTEGRWQLARPGLREPCSWLGKSLRKSWPWKGWFEEARAWRNMTETAQARRPRHHTSGNKPATSVSMIFLKKIPSRNNFGYDFSWERLHMWVKGGVFSAALEGVSSGQKAKLQHQPPQVIPSEHELWKTRPPSCGVLTREDRSDVGLRQETAFISQPRTTLGIWGAQGSPEPFLGWAFEHKNSILGWHISVNKIS